MAGPERKYKDGQTTIDVVTQLTVDSELDFKSLSTIFEKYKTDRAPHLEALNKIATEAREAGKPYLKNLENRGKVVAEGIVCDIREVWDWASDRGFYDEESDIEDFDEEGDQEAEDVVLEIPEGSISRSEIIDVAKKIGLKGSEVTFVEVLSEVLFGDEESVSVDPETFNYIGDDDEEDSEAGEVFGCEGILELRGKWVMVDFEIKTEEGSDWKVELLIHGFVHPEDKKLLTETFERCDLLTQVAIASVFIYGAREALEKAIALHE